MYADGVHPFLIRANPAEMGSLGHRVLAVHRGGPNPGMVPPPLQNPNPLGMGVVNPVILNLLTGRAQPMFSGVPGDFEKFSQERARYDAILQQAQGAGMSDFMRLHVLRLSLDPPSTNKLDAASRANSNLTFKAFWDGLVREFSHEPASYHRQKWAKVTMKMV